MKKSTIKALVALSALIVSVHHSNGASLLNAAPCLKRNKTARLAILGGIGALAVGRLAWYLYNHWPADARPGQIPPAQPQLPSSAQIEQELNTHMPVWAERIENALGRVKTISELDNENARLKEEIRAASLSSQVKASIENKLQDKYYFNKVCIEASLPSTARNLSDDGGSSEPVSAERIEQRVNRANELMKQQVFGIQLTYTSRHGIEIAMEKARTGNNQLMRNLLEYLHADECNSLFGSAAYKQIGWTDMLEKEAVPSEFDTSDFMKQENQEILRAMVAKPEFSFLEKVNH